MCGWWRTTKKMVEQHDKPPRRRWPEVVALLSGLPLIVFLAGIVWVGIHWLPVATVALLAGFYLVIGLYVIGLIWLVLRVLAARRTFKL